MKNLFRIVCLGIFVYVAYWSFYFYQYGFGQHLGNGYVISTGRTDDVFVGKNGKIAISPTVIEWATASGYFVGLRMPSGPVECDNGSWYKVRVVNERNYVVLNMSTDEISFYDSREAFESALDELDISGDVSLDYSKFDEIWAYYSSTNEEDDFSNCVPMSDREVGVSIE